jgi:hypothetical protein
MAVILATWQAEIGKGLWSRPSWERVRLYLQNNWSKNGASVRVPAIKESPELRFQYHKQTQKYFQSMIG